MKELKLGSIVAAVKGTLICGNWEMAVKNVVTTLKTAARHTLVLPAGDSPIDWQAAALLKEPIAVVTAGPVPAGLPPEVSVVLVNHNEEAYWRFVSFYRSMFSIPVIGITGTCGKTTTKEMIKAILEPDYRLQATVLSNNGLSLNLSYLLGCEADTQAAVFEMGVAYPGNLLNSCRHFEPNIGLITNIGVDHLFGCKTLEAYIAAKAEILAGLRFEGRLIINADDSNIQKIDLSHYRGEVIGYGRSAGAQFKITDSYYGENGMYFGLLYQGKEYSNLFVPAYGLHNVYNAAAAIAAVQAAGLSDIAAAAGQLKAFRPVDRHLEFFTGLKGATVIDDTWSANPTSVEAALAVLVSLAGCPNKTRKTVAVLGSMELLGGQADEEYRKLGDKIAAMNMDVLVTVGGPASAIANQVLAATRRVSVYICQTVREATAVLAAIAEPETMILVKASMLGAGKDSFKDIISSLRQHG